MSRPVNDGLPTVPSIHAFITDAARQGLSARTVLLVFQSWLHRGVPRGDLLAALDSARCELAGKSRTHADDYEAATRRLL